MTTTTKKRGRTVSGLLAGGGALFGLLLTLLIPGIAPWSPSVPPAVAVADCAVTYFALDPANLALPNPAKEVPAAFGPAVTARGETDVKAELNERRECGADGKFDPALTASHYSAWSEAGLTKYKVAYTEIDAFTADIAANATKYNEVLTELKGLENASAYSEEGVPAGIWSLYMDPNGSGGVNVKQGRTSADGTNAVFTNPSGAVIKYRLDCGFQVNRSGSGSSDFPGMPQCTPETCPPPTCPPNTTPWPECNELKWIKPTTQEPGWVPDGTGNGITDERGSQNQQDNGETRGNAGNDQVADNSSTNNGGKTVDTKPSGQGGPVDGGGTAGGDDQGAAVNQPNSNQNDGGTSGDTGIAVPAD
jgi:hypothetical protein